MDQTSLHSDTYTTTYNYIERDWPHFRGFFASYNPSDKAYEIGSSVNCFRLDESFLQACCQS